MINIVDSNKNIDEKLDSITTSTGPAMSVDAETGKIEVEDDDWYIRKGRSMWCIPGDQITKLMNRMADIREVPNDDPIEFIKATYDLMGTLDTILFDDRNYKWIPEEDEDDRR